MFRVSVAKRLRFVVEVALHILVCEYELYVLRLLIEITLLLFSKYNARCLRIHQSRLFSLGIFKVINYMNKKPHHCHCCAFSRFIMTYLLDA